MKRLIAAVIGASFLLAACNTMEGFGRDLEKGGQKIEDKAADVKRGN
jgi:predicted small secreted protein